MSGGSLLVSADVMRPAVIVPQSSAQVQQQYTPVQQQVIIIRRKRCSPPLNTPLPPIMRPFLLGLSVFWLYDNKLMIPIFHGIK